MILDKQLEFDSGMDIGTGALLTLDSANDIDLGANKDFAEGQKLSVIVSVVELPVPTVGNAAVHAELLILGATAPGFGGDIRVVGHAFVKDILNFAAVEVPQFGRFEIPLAMTPTIIAGQLTAPRYLRARYRNSGGATEHFQSGILRIYMMMGDSGYGQGRIYPASLGNAT